MARDRKLKATFVVCRGKGRKRIYWNGRTVTCYRTEAHRFSWRFDAAKIAKALWSDPSFSAPDWYVQEL